MENILTKCTAEISNFMICGDMNINMLKSNNCLNDLFDAYGVKNIVKIECSEAGSSLYL